MVKYNNNITIKQYLSSIKAWGRSECDYIKTGSYFSLFIEAEYLLSVASLLLERNYFLESISGVDVEEGILLIYHFDRFDKSERLTVRILVSRYNKRVPSLFSVYTGADWHERECFDFFGVIFVEHPNLKPLLLPEDLGFYPLLKEKNRISIYALFPLKVLVDC